jgi:hypothetical protein
MGVTPVGIPAPFPAWGTVTLSESLGNIGMKWSFDLRC